MTRSRWPVYFPVHFLVPILGWVDLEVLVNLQPPPTPRHSHGDSNPLSSEHVSLCIAVTHIGNNNIGDNRSDFDDNSNYDNN